MANFKVLSVKEGTRPVEFSSHEAWFVDMFRNRAIKTEKSVDRIKRRLAELSITKRRRSYNG